ncbi:MAG TPA: cupin domain-containing protein [Gaiellaceae bacterium]
MIEDSTSGWFVASVRELPWQENELGSTCEFDKHRERFAALGINLTVLRPGQPMTMYHREGDQEGFLVLDGECLLIVEGREVPLRRWDYFHCPPDVAHAIVGAGDGLSVILAVGSRVGPDAIVYPRDETALKHGAGVEHETRRPQEAYAPFTRPAPEIAFRDELLPE